MSTTSSDSQLPPRDTATRRFSRTSLTSTTFRSDTKVLDTSSSASMDGNGTRLQSQSQRPTTAPTPTRLPARTRLAPKLETPHGTPTPLPSPRSQPRLLISHTQTTQELSTHQMERFTPLHENEKEI